MRNASTVEQTLLLETTNLISNNTADFLLWQASIRGNIRFLEWVEFLGGGLEPLVFSFGVEIEVTTVVIESPQR